MKKWILRNIPVLIGVVIGAAVGYLYWKFEGCSSGSCAITSRPVNSTMYGAMMGGLLFSFFQKEKKQAADDKEISDKN